MSKISVSTNFEGKEYSLETGRFAKFANGAVMVRCGDTMVLVTVVAGNKPVEGIDYLPLQVEYREKTASAGKIPGGFFKREGKPTEHEVLSARLIDRPIRPMLPKTWNFETQIISTVFSSEPDVLADTLGAVGASAALMISDIPFVGPISEVTIARVDGQFVCNPTMEMLEKSDMEMTVAGTDDSIAMVEGESKEISEEDFLNALQYAHEKIRELNKLQNDLLANFQIAKRPYVIKEANEELVGIINQTIGNELTENVHLVTTKNERQEWRERLLGNAFEAAKVKYSEEPEFDEDQLKKDCAEILHDLEKAEMRKMIIEEGKRLDGRTLTDIRKITCEIGVLPRCHGSALFTRGETQSLTTVTLGTKNDEQQIEGLGPSYTNKFILHYNFPPFSTGEVGRMMTGRREVGHGNLAERALKNMIPENGDFPYTIRVVSDILESNGSSSMATVCAGSLSLFEAGVPMKKPVAGIAMGLIKEDDKVAVLSDILGDEDHLGDMDFKVTGTQEGITACQMDIKIQGLSIDIMRTALEQARLGRLHILSIMNDTISEPREELSEYAPKYTIIKIPTDCIGAVIGPGGENIRGIIKESGSEINIDDSGQVTVSSPSLDSNQIAIRMIEAIIRRPEEGDIYNGTVKEIKEGIGAIIEFLPKKQGLLHISQISHEHTKNVGDVLKQGDKVEVKLIEVTSDGKFRLSRKALLPRPEGMPEETHQSHRGPSSHSAPRSPHSSDRPRRDNPRR